MTDHAHARQALDGLTWRIEQAIANWQTAPAQLLGLLTAARDSLAWDTPPFDGLYRELEAAWSWTQAQRAKA